MARKTVRRKTAKRSRKPRRTQKKKISFSKSQMRKFASALRQEEE